MRESPRTDFKRDAAHVQDNSGNSPDSSCIFHDPRVWPDWTNRSITSVYCVFNPDGSPVRRCRLTPFPRKRKGVGDE